MDCGLAAFGQKRWLAAVSTNRDKPKLGLSDQPFEDWQGQVGLVAGERHAASVITVEYLCYDSFRAVRQL